MLDFTSALYLGLRHPSAALPAWSALSLGRPAALQEPPGASAVAARLAALMGTEAAILLPSTLHLFWDLFGLLSRQRIALFIDGASYPIARWGARCWASPALPVQTFAAHSPQALRQCIREFASLHLTPVALADCFSPALGRPAPLAAYADILAERGGHLVVDDTQALGVLGVTPQAQAPYGTAGGGSLRWQGIGGPQVIVGASLAKGFGVPVAVLAGSRALIENFAAASTTQVHCSPPSAASIAAAQHALAMNERCGDEARARLLDRVARFRQRLRDIGLTAGGGLFPIQTLDPIETCDGARLHRRLLAGGVRAVLHRARAHSGPAVTFLITALHPPPAIDQAVGVIERALRGRPRPSTAGHARYRVPVLAPHF
jgi:8-amino-7-oxononanoate synthase